MGFVFVGDGTWDVKKIFNVYFVSMLRLIFVSFGWDISLILL